MSAFAPVQSAGGLCASTSKLISGQNCYHRAGKRISAFAASGQDPEHHDTMQTMTFTLPNLASPVEAARITKHLQALNGVASAQVSLKDREALVTTDGQTTAGAIIASLAELGVSGTLIPVASRPRHRNAAEAKASAVRVITASYPVLGMTCASCAVSVETMLNAEPGVMDAVVNYVNQSVRVNFDQDTVTPAQMRDVVKSIGYDLLIDVREDSDELEQAHAKRIRTLTIRTIGSAALAIPTAVIAMLLMDFVPGARWVMLMLTAPVMIWAGREFFTTAWNQAKRGTSTMDTLVALSTGTAFLYSASATIAPAFFAQHGLQPHVYYEAAALIITFILLGRLLEERAKSKTSSAIKKLMGLQPKTLRVVRDGREVTVPMEEARPGDVVIIRPGEKIPVDGSVIDGSSFVDESMIRGEPVPVEKTAGEALFAGTINQKGSLRIKAEKVGSGTLLAAIIRMVKEAQGSKAPLQRLADRVAAVFVPTVLLIALISFAAWWVFGPEPAMTRAIMSAITVLIIACPCALGLATPTAIMVGVGRGAESGILIKDAESLERAHKVNAIVFDKTGTITKGEPEVTDLVWTDRADERPLHESILLSIESRSEHPLAEAVLRRFSGADVARTSIDKFDSVPGRGVSAVVGTTRYLIGNESFLAEHSLAIGEALRGKAHEFAAQAKTVVYFAGGNRVLAAVALADTIKESSPGAIRLLSEMGIETHLLTGDHQSTADVVARATGIAHVLADALPSDKGAYIEALQKQGKVVAMVGDGINDSVALAKADVGIAMAKGTDIAMEAAKITLMKSDLGDIVDALKLSRATVQTVKQNLFWAFIYNVIGIPIAAGALVPAFGFQLNPMIAGAAMALSSVSVVSNSLRLKTKAI